MFKENTMTSEKSSTKRELGLRTVQGIIQPYSQDSQKVALLEHNTEKEFCILLKGAGVDLVDYVSEEMELIGIVTEIEEDEELKYTIQVRSYVNNEEF